MTTLGFDLFWRDHGVRAGFDQIGRASDKAHAKVAQFSKGTGRGLSAIGGVASKVGATAGLALGAAGVAAVGFGIKAANSAGQFQATMRQVGVTTGQTGKGLQDLTKVALDMGAKTSFSAKGASEAMLALAKGGMTAAQMKAGALQQTLTLASAGGLELGHAADYMVQGLTAFGLKAKDSSRVAASLAGAANASTASVESMGQALSQVGAQAKLSGLSIEDTTAALAAFDNAGVKGSDAGTSFKSFLQRLVPSAKAARDEMRSLGLITKDGSNQFFDASGKMKSMADVAGILQNALKGQTKEQKIATLTTIFGTDASRAAAILTDEGRKGIEKYVKATSDKSSAEKLAKSATEGYSGAMERFKGSVETAQIQIGTKMLPVLSKMLDFLSGKAMPALSRIGHDLAPAFAVGGEALKSFGKIASAVFSSFVQSFGNGQASFKSFAEYLQTHQEDITRSLVNGGKGALQLGRALATGSSTGLRAFGFLVDGMATGTEGILTMFGNIAQGSLAVWGWIPGIGPKLAEANAKFQTFGASAVRGMRGAASGARGAADAIDKHVVPAIDKAQGSLDKIGKTEIAKAALRDSAAKAALAIKNIGTTSDGAQIHLKKFADMSKLGAGQQAALRQRLSDARGALQGQIRTMQDAHVGQDKLTAAWKKGKDRLYDEFRQMGLSRAEARRLAAQYAGVKPKVSTKFEQPGMTEAQRRAKDYRGKIHDIPTKWNTSANLTFRNNAGSIVANLNKTFQLVKGGPKMKLATGGVMPGYTPGRDVHHFSSPTGGDLALSGGEAVMVPQWTKAVGGPKAVDRMNRAARSGQAFAGGGVFGGYGPAGINATSREGTSGSQMYGWGVKKKIEGAMAYAKANGGGGGAAGLGDPAHVSNPRAVASYKGGRFTRLFIANLKAAERDAGRGFSIYQGGFRPTTSYSGSTHNMDAIDARVNYALLRAFRKHVGAMGDRTGLGNWASHMHGVPAPGHGYGSPSARAQYRDYLRRGGARQGYRSPWGLAGGGLMVDPSTVNVSERAPERVLSARQTVSFERLTSALDKTGGMVKIEFNVTAPNYVGSVDDLVRGLMKADQRGALEPLKRRFRQ